jgi:hypothetical protein
MQVILGLMSSIRVAQEIMPLFFLSASNKARNIRFEVVHL